MNFLTETHPSFCACQDAAVGLAREALAQGRKPVLIVPSYTHQIAAQTWLAKHNGSFGISVTTPLSWIEDIWKLLGSGEELISGFMRIFTINSLLGEHPALPNTPGMLNLLNDCAFEALPFIESAKDLSSTESEAIALLASYREHIHSLNFIEPCEASVQLSHTNTLKRFKPILLGFDEHTLSRAQMTLFEATQACILINSQADPVTEKRNPELIETSRILYRRSENSSPVNPSGSLRLALASGPSASKRLVTDQIVDALENGNTKLVVASEDPFDLFSFAAPLLTQQGISCGISAHRKLEQTDIGQALLALGQLTYNLSNNPRDADVLTAADYSYSPFSGIDQKAAFRISRMHRGNRLTLQDEILSDLASSTTDNLAGLIALTEKNDWPTVAAMLQDYLDKRFGACPVYHSEQSRVLTKLADTWPLSKSLTLHELMRLIGGTTIATNAETAPDAHVIFCTQSTAASFAAGSADCVIFADLSAETNPIKAPENALQTLLAKMEAAPIVEPLSRARATFYDAFQVASKRVVLQRPVNNAEGSPAQAATVFEEVLDCYRPHLRTEEGIIKPLSIPESLLPFTAQRGEQDVLTNQAAPSGELTECLQPAIGCLSKQSHDLVILPYLYGAGIFSGLDLSPSQIESYLECPYSWFAKRRLKLEGVDEGFTPMERGTFMHDVLHRFYLAFQSQVQPKVTLDTLALAESILEEVFTQACAQQALGHPGSRYVAINSWEEKERQSVLRKLKNYLSSEAELLPHFEPRYFEWQFANERPFPYAGCNLRGCVDRIDVDTCGNAVVIDYKSSLSNSYRLAGFENSADQFELPPKMQALIYAKVVRDTLGLNVVATLYVNPLKSQVLGVWDSSVLKSSDIPFSTNADMEACRLPSGFVKNVNQLIDLGENSIKEKLANLAQGIIEPAPARKDACEYCPVNVCEHRLCPRRL